MSIIQKLKLIYSKVATHSQFFFYTTLLFFITFIFLGLFRQDWSFIHDDFGVVWHCKLTSWRNVIKFFYENSTQTFMQPSNYRIPVHDFFSIYYRPLSHIFYAIENFLFSFSPFLYFTTRILFHSINTSLLHYFFYLITRNQAVSFLAALTFAFHPTLAAIDGLRIITAQDHTINLTFLLLCILFLRRYLLFNKKWSLFLSVSLFGCALFCIETALFFPVIIMLGIYFYKKDLLLSLRIGCFYSLISLGYLLIRLTLYPIRNTTAVYSFINLINPLRTLQNRIFDFINLCCGLAYIPWLGEGHTIMKISILFVFASIVFMIFVFSRCKLLHLVTFLCFFIMLYPILFRNYSERYLYSALPLFILFFIFSFVHFTIKFPPALKKLCIAFVGVFITINGIFTVRSLYRTSKESLIINNALKQLVTNKEIFNKKLCFIGLPRNWFAYGIAQAVWMQGINQNFPIYYDNQTLIYFENTSLMLKATPIKNGFRLTILNTNNASFSKLSDANLSMGKSFIHKKNNDNVLDISYILDKQWLDENPYFITWDYKKNIFMPLGYL